MQYNGPAHELNVDSKKQNTREQTQVTVHT